MSLQTYRWFCLFMLGLSVSKGQNGCCLEAAEGKSGSLVVAEVELRADYATWSLVVKWPVKRNRGAGPQGLGGSPTFQVEVARFRNLTVIHSTNVSSSAMEGSDVLTWTWASTLPLECADHSVRIRQYHPFPGPGPWSLWKTNAGVEPVEGEGARTKMFPYQQVLREGSSVYLCCVPPRGARITDMEFGHRTPYPPVPLENGAAALRVDHLNLTSDTGVFFSCRDSKLNKKKYCSNFVSFPPQRPENLTCETSDLRTVTCNWNPGRTPNLSLDYKRTYTLYVDAAGRSSARAPVSCQNAGTCDFQVIPGVEQYQVTLVVKNQLGEERQSYSFNITDRVFPVPDWGEGSVGVREAQLFWVLRGNLSGLDLLCQLTTEPGGSDTMVHCEGSEGGCGVRLEHLQPNSRYTNRLRCSVIGRLWGEWTRLLTFHTDPLVSLDVWRQISGLPYPLSRPQSLPQLRPHPSSQRDLTLLWIPLVSGVDIQGYLVDWEQGGQNGTLRVGGGRAQKAELSIGPGRCDVTVRAVLRGGPSLPARLTIPGLGDAEGFLVTRRVSGSAAAGFCLSWAEQEAVTCGYTVEWCTLGSVVPCTLRWRKMPNASLSLPAGDFKAGCRYTFNVSGCTADGHRLLEVQTGYVQELRPTVSPSPAEHVMKRTSSSVTLEWHYHDDDPMHPGFIIGYLVTVQEGGLQNSPANDGQIPFNVSVEDPHRKSVTILGLQENQQYTFHLSALTKEGPGPGTAITVTTTQNYPVLLAKILIPVLLLLLACTLLLWQQKNRLKNGIIQMFGISAGFNIKTIQLDSHLREMSERLGALRVEECVCCDVEIVDLRASVMEGSTLLLPRLLQPSSSLLPSQQLLGDYCPQTSKELWDRPACQRMTSLTNHSYLPTLGVELRETESQPSSPTYIDHVTFCESTDWPELRLGASLELSSGYCSYEASI